MKTAIVTGATSGIGLETSKMLIDLGYKVYGIGRDFSKYDFYNENFLKVPLDLLNIYEVECKIKEILKNDDIDILINNAGVGYFGLHEELNVKKIHELVTVNLEVPLILTQLLLRNLKKTQGFIINISSVTAKMSSTHGCAYGATKAGLTHFSNSLFDECRKYGVKVIAIHPDMTDTNFYRNANFTTDSNETSHICAKEVASFIKTTITQRCGLVITDITIKPQHNKIQKKKGF